MTYNRILIIQTAFIGDVVLASGVAEALHSRFPSATIDFVVRKGNEGLFNDHPFLHEVLIWDKKGSKYRNLFGLLQKIRGRKYDLVINLQRFMASGFLTAFSGARETRGYAKNPLAFLFSKSFPHEIGKKGDKDFKHEVSRNFAIIQDITGNVFHKPRLYPGQENYIKVGGYTPNPFITISPASVWFTKQYPVAKWIEFLDTLPADLKVYLTGGPADTDLCLSIQTGSKHKNIDILAGKLTYLETAALMQKAVMNYANDSAPMHFASAVNAPVTTVYCSTIPEFGFGPLSDNSYIVEIQEPLACRPCGLHGYKACPLGHFHCAIKIDPNS